MIQERPVCKYKWQSTLLEYEKIVDFDTVTRCNAKEYLHLTYIEMCKNNLLHTFSYEVYHSMQEFMMHHSIMNPCHLYDFLCHGNGNYNCHTNIDNPSIDILALVKKLSFATMSNVTRNVSCWSNVT